MTLKEFDKAICSFNYRLNIRGRTETQIEYYPNLQWIGYANININNGISRTIHLNNIENRIEVLALIFK